MTDRNRGPTLRLLLDLCARLRLACEAVGEEHGVHPSDVRLDDLSPAARARLERLAQQDLWALINETHHPATATALRRSNGAA